jgi:hypothetical protein
VALQKLYCTKPRAASAALWGLDGACHRDSDLPAAAAKSWHRGGPQRDCSVDARPQVDEGLTPGNAGVGTHEDAADPGSTLCEDRFSQSSEHAHHDVSSLTIGLTERGANPRSNTSTMRMRPPQQGQGGGVSSSPAAGGSISFGSTCTRAGTSSSSRQRASLSARWPLANSP